MLRDIVWDFLDFSYKEVHGQKLQVPIHLIDPKHFCIDQSCHLVTVLIFKNSPGADNFYAAENCTVF